MRRDALRAAGGRIVAQRLQLPLDLGWAMSVHKSQGLTLDRWERSMDRKRFFGTPQGEQHWEPVTAPARGMS